MLYLVRHGQTNGNAQRIVQTGETPLNQIGEEQAFLVANSLKRTGAKLVLSSDYQRAHQTAKKIASACGCSVKLTSCLRERDFGELKGKSYGEFGEIDVFAEDYVPPKGESAPDFHRRVKKAWVEVTQTYSEIQAPVIVVTHGLVLKSLINNQLEKIESGIPENFLAENTSVTTVAPITPWKVISLANTEHLGKLKKDTELGSI